MIENENRFLNNKRVALVCDPVYRYNEIGIFSGLRSRIFTLPHIGMAILDNELMKQGAKVDFFNIRDNQLVQRTREYDIVGLSVNTVHALLAARLTNEIIPPLVLGGIFPSTNRDWIEENAPKAIVVSGYGEGLLPRILSDIARGQVNRTYIQSSSFDIKRDYIRPSKRKQTPFLIEMNAVEAGRGCSIGCNFCSPTVFDNGIHIRDINDLKSELFEIAKDPSRRRIPVVFVDNNLSIYPKGFLHELIDYVNTLGLLWGGEGISTKYFMEDETLLNKMAKNCVGFYTGIEDVISTDVSSGKGRNFNEITNIVNTYRRIGLPVYYSIVVGTDTHQYPETFYRLKEAIQELGILANIHLAVPHPGTPFYKNIVKDGRIIDKDFAHYDHKHVVFHPKNMSSDQLIKGYLWLKHSLATNTKLNKRIIKDSPQLTPLVLEFITQVLGEMTFRNYRHLDKL
jgi:radical SAM superfamily enzyme YgiQ (UPF0313 family)